MACSLRGAGGGARRRGPPRSSRRRSRCSPRSGFSAARIDDVAARAGISKGTLYLYFSSKEELFKAVVRQALLPNLARVERMLAAHPGTGRRAHRS